MKRIVMLFLALTLLAFPLVGGCTTEEEETFELTYNNFFPPTNYNSILADAFCKEIEARTDGRVTFTYYPAGGLAAAADTYDAVVEGIADIGMSCLAYTMGRFPASELVDLPHGYPNGWVATMVATDFYNEFMPDEFDDSHPLYFHAHGPGIVFTVDKPVRTLEDMQGLVLRSTGNGAAIAEALGATGYAAAQGDAYELMSKGTIDGSMTPMEPLLGWKQAEVVNYVTNCYDVAYTTDFFVVMNLDKWNELPDDIQDIFTEVSEEWAEKHAMLWSYYDIAAKEYFLSFAGKEVIELSATEMARWVDAAAVVKDNYMVDKAALGLSVDDFEDYLNERVDYWSGRSPSDNDFLDWFDDELTPLLPTE
ncbi:MAG TPA: TRAP transporter substrate-binding protein DctP [Dehalococcoidales bacterium]|nr:TRAP transporter substrate-binding protein DctP [Dehalococcoidales bacterium]